ncbi:MAG: TIGR03790 family protein [Pseudomonadales bacterium]|nr:TIGR03790 family protein [Pseudomonadales bacterium]
MAVTGPFIELPKTGLTSSDLAVVYLKGDKKSEAIARYYQKRRNIPARNIIAINLDAKKTVIGPGKFAVQKKLLDSQLDDSVQALALAWSKPYQVGCMSMSAAFTFGYNVAYCSSSCTKTRTSPYYHSMSVAPYRDFKIRPTMMLAAADVDDAITLIDRGVAADDTQPLARAFLLTTADKRRSVRNVFFDEIRKHFANIYDVQILNANGIQNRNDILFYFTGAVSVPHLNTLTFLPGAMADHLTSAGGQLTDSSQMSAMRWLEAGATGSYGAAIEPCNFVEKFPNPLLAMRHYSYGSTILEAYWKSVYMPGQGNFIGEPLASPFNGYRLVRKKDRIEIHSPVLREGRYRVVANEESLAGLNTPSYLQAINNVSIQSVTPYRRHLEIKPPYQMHYKIERLSSDKR